MALQKQPIKKRIRNREERKRAQARYYAKTKETRRQKRLDATRHWLLNNPNYHSNYRKNKSGLINAKTAKRRANKLQATPKWLSKLQLSHIKLFYTAAVDFSKETNVKFEVDHIIPLQGEHVSGLHVPWNLQVIPLKDNRRKGNKHGAC